MANKFEAMPGDLTISQCAACAHWLGNKRCDAFPEGIPDIILDNEHDHKTPYPGDDGIRFEQRK